MVLCDGLLPLHSNILSPRPHIMAINVHRDIQAGRQAGRQVGLWNPNNDMETNLEDVVMIPLIYSKNICQNVSFSFVLSFTYRLL